MNDWMILSIAVAIWYGIVAVKVAYNKKHRELCDRSGRDYRIIALFWLPFCLFVLVNIWFFNKE